MHNFHFVSFDMLYFSPMVFIYSVIPFLSNAHVSNHSGINKLSQQVQTKETHPLWTHPFKTKMRTSPFEDLLFEYI